MLSPISFALLAIVAPLQGPVPGVVRGHVRSESTAAPVAGARIELVGVAGPGALADSLGNYVLRGVPPGRQIVRASHIDHEALQVEIYVPAGGEFILDFDLEVRPVALPRVIAEVLAVRGARDTVAAAAPELSAASIRALEASPGVAELGIAEAARQLPTDQPIDPSDILYVRGTAADLKLILLDGAPVYAPFHLAGLIEPLEAGVLRAASLFLGGAPARYDGGLSYVMDLETRAGRRSRHQVSAAVDFLAVKGMAEGPISRRVGFLLESRALHGLGPRLFLNESLPYGYADGLMRVDVDVGSDGVITVTGFWNEESVDVDTSRSAVDPAKWGNAAGSVRYRGVILGTDAELTASYGTFGAAMPLGDGKPILARGDSRRLRLNADFGAEVGAAQVRFGMTYDRLEIDQQLESYRSEGGTTVRAFQERTDGAVTGAYVDASVRPVGGLVLRGGLRADVFSHSPALRLAPRLAATWIVTDRFVVKLGAGRYRQYVSVPEPLGMGVGPTWPGARAARTPLAVARASHLVLGLDHDVGQGIRVGVESFIKRFEGMPSILAPALPIETKAPDTESHASGVDLWMQRSSGRVQGWLGYSVAWVWSDRGGHTLTRPASGRQLVSAGLSGPIGPDGEFEIRLNYGAGLPYTPVPEVGTREPAFAADQFPIAFMRAEGAGGGAPARPDHPYLRIDAQISHTWTTRLREARVEVTPYIRVLNALDRRDALFYRFDAEGSLQPLGVLPLLPVLGVEWRF
ncbi:MAG: TonB-dependent receptor [bacterium]|jgi:hypothetical protein|nr:MAG: hypothetical protein DIU52_11150 [bacterium]